VTTKTSARAAATSPFRATTFNRSCLRTSTLLGATLNPYQEPGRMATHAQQYKSARPDHEGRAVVLSMSLFTTNSFSSSSSCNRTALFIREDIQARATSFAARHLCLFLPSIDVHLFGSSISLRDCAMLSLPPSLNFLRLRLFCPSTGGT
jgi:hypothetical protein